jgi:hypothetical protein
MQTAMKEDAKVEKGSCILSATTRLVWHDYAGPGARAPDPIQPPHFFVHPHSLCLIETHRSRSKKTSLDGILNLFIGSGLSGASHVFCSYESAAIEDADGAAFPALALHGTQGGEK